MRYLRTALENQTDNKAKTVVMKGTLSEVYTQALNIAYAKNDDVTGEAMIPEPVKLAMESQQMDMAGLQKLAEMLVPEQTQEPGNVTVYGVDKNTVDPETVHDVTQQLEAARLNKDDLSDFVLIIDGTQDQEATPVERFVELPVALESIASAYGARVYHSLGEFIKTL